MCDRTNELTFRQSGARNLACDLFQVDDDDDVAYRKPLTSYMIRPYIYLLYIYDHVMVVDCTAVVVVVVLVVDVDDDDDDDVIAIDVAVCIHSSSQQLSAVC